MAKDISTMIGETAFNFRVACFFEYDGKILLHRNFKVDDFWNLPGGRVKCGETTKNAIMREMEEELGYKFSSDRFNLIQINEMFFNYNNVDCHELNFMYYLKLNSEDELTQKQDFVCLDNCNLSYHWFDKKEVVKDNLKCLPLTIYSLAKREDFSNIVWATETK